MYSGAITNAAYVIMKRNYAPAAERLAALVARERQMPAVLLEARKNLDTPPRIYTEIAIEQIDGNINFFKTERIPTRENLDAGGNRARYRNPEIDRLITEGRRTLDRDGRKRIYGEIQRILARDVPVVSLWHEDNLVAMRKNVQGFVMLPTSALSNLDKAYKTKSKR